MVTKKVFFLTIIDLEISTSLSKTFQSYLALWWASFLRSLGQLKNSAFANTKSELIWIFCLVVKSTPGVQIQGKILESTTEFRNQIKSEGK